MLVSEMVRLEELVGVSSWVVGLDVGLWVVVTTLEPAVAPQET